VSSADKLAHFKKLASVLNRVRTNAGMQCEKIFKDLDEAHAILSNYRDGRSDIVVDSKSQTLCDFITRGDSASIVSNSMDEYTKKLYINVIDIALAHVFLLCSQNEWHEAFCEADLIHNIPAVLVFNEEGRKLYFSRVEVPCYLRSAGNQKADYVRLFAALIEETKQ
jgi:hypothetical protein